ncbi:hypothetical protein GWK91_15415 [Virgibacillus sp. MSP4-1]|uniref:Uncharacterized protein n=1 Tax=Salinibacillus aidingensis TaxID=237684 RepID=A0ABN1BH49_9BACI|nr:hypothetical protein [Virgibacillus sp. MSP4-1]QHS24201.1 hypothetical protein GWK91_15415 [Virgibacillus sp. MSP4-1]
MKKLLTGLLAGGLLLGGASFVAAETNGYGPFSFEEMQPFMEEMHPDFSREQQEQMFNDCHGEDGYMRNQTEYRGMMNNF